LHRARPLGRGRRPQGQEHQRRDKTSSAIHSPLPLCRPPTGPADHQLSLRRFRTSRTTTAAAASTPTIAPVLAALRPTFAVVRTFFRTDFRPSAASSFSASRFVSRDISASCVAVPYLGTGV